MSCISSLKSKGYNCNFVNTGSDFVGWDSAVSLGNHYGMDGSGFEPQWKLFFYTRLDWDWGQSSLLGKGCRAPSPEVKWPGREVYRPTQGGAEVEEWAELRSNPPSP